MLLKPTAREFRVTDITPEQLKGMGVSALLLDVDNTLSTHHGTVLLDGLIDWINNMQHSGIELLILSNSKERRVKPFAEGLGLGFVSLGLKPLPFGFIRALKKLKLKKREVALAGDQIFTDVLGARLMGIKVFLLEPIKLEDGVSFKIRRKLELKLKKYYDKKGWF